MLYLRRFAPDAGRDRARNPDALHFANRDDAGAHEAAHLAAMAREFLLLRLMDQVGYDAVEGGVEELGAG